MAKKQFKSESKRLLDLMINSIYTHKEIFLRELISNASDATDKLYYLSLSDENIEFNREDFYIRISVDKEKRTITISDNGIGMSKEELEDNLGTIAKSGSFAFKNENESVENVDIIGQFGVGFYSAFMISDCVTVTSRKFGSDQAYVWTSTGADGYTVVEGEKDKCGTEIVLSVKKDSEDEKYSEFLKEYKLRELIKKYSDYIKYPIKMMVTKSRLKEGSESEFETYKEEETLNSMVPLWRKNKNEIAEDEYNKFYRESFFDYDDPYKVIHTSADGAVSFTALMYIPKNPPFDYYTKEFKRGLSLYTNGVMIMDKCEDLLPDYFGFVRGVVDSADLSLNISREMLQHDRQLKVIATSLKKKIKSELLSEMKKDREAYEKFFNAFGRPIKFGVYDNFGVEKDFLKDLLMFYSLKEDKMITLSEYVEKMSDEQKEIYYACGESVEKIKKLPQTEGVSEQGYDVLCMCEDVDEFLVKVLMEFDGKQFKNVSESDSKADESTNDADKDVFDFLTESLENKVKEVKPSSKLKTHPVCISSTGPVSIEMEKVLNRMPNDNQVKAERILEINVNHSVFDKIKELYDTDKDKLKKFIDVVYNGALLIEGLSVDDPVEFSNNICDLIS